MEMIYCPWEPATYLFFSSNVPLLIHYSHFIAIFSALAVALLIFVNNPRSTVSRLFVFFAALFSAWALLDVGLWATNDPSFVMFAWAMQILLEPLTYAIALLLFYIFLYRSTPPLGLSLFVVLTLLPLVILLPTTLNLEGLLLSACESIEGPVAKYMTYVLNITYTLAIIYFAVKKIPDLELTRRKSAIFFLTGLVTFLLSFTSGNIIGSFTEDWTLSQYGLFGMPVFAFLIAYSIVQFKTFQIQIAGAQMLVVVLWALVASLLFVEAELLKIVAGVTLIFTSVAGFLLIKSVKQEFKQRLELEDLTERLERANVRLKVLDQLKSEFVSIASHQLRSPLTAIRGYTSMLLEGSYGKMTDKAQNAIEHIADSSRLMAMSIEDYLNVSRIESGNMKYELDDFNFNDTVSRIVDDLRTAAVKKGLVLTYKSDIDHRGIVHADQGKTQQIIHNLIDNAMKYTPKGSIDVTVYEKEEKGSRMICADIKDTGVGIAKEHLETIFEKFMRAKNAHKVNISGSGLGLYVAQKMADDMGGGIRVKSEGEGKGSIFTFYLPLQM